jgi:hypothetical protein
MTELIQERATLPEGLNIINSMEILKTWAKTKAQLYHAEFEDVEILSIEVYSR